MISGGAKPKVNCMSRSGVIGVADAVGSEHGKVAAQRAVGMAVLVGVAKPHTLAEFELDLARTLDLQEEKLDRIYEPARQRTGRPLMVTTEPSRCRGPRSALRHGWNLTGNRQADWRASHN